MSEEAKQAVWDMLLLDGNCSDPALTGAAKLRRILDDLIEVKLAIGKSCDDDRQEILSRGHGGCPEAARLEHELELCRAVTTLCCKKALTPLERFGLAVLEEHRNEITDVDGGWLQDTAVALGMLAEVNATEACGEHCKCAEYGDFPQECLRETDAIRSKMAEFREKTG